MIRPKISLISIAAALVFFLVGAPAHALTIDTSALDTLQTASHGPFGMLNWPGITMKLTKNGANTTSAELTVKSPVRLETAAWLTLDKPQTASLSRIVKSANGSMILEHVDLIIDSTIPTLQVTSRSTVRLTEVAQLDPKIDRAHRIPIYAYRTSDGHVVVVAGAAGQSIQNIEGRAADEGENASCGARCVFERGTWTTEMVDLDLAKDHPVAQARGDVEFDKAPKGEANAPRTFVINASYTQTARDPQPVVALTMHTIETVFQGDGDEE